MISPIFTTSTPPLAIHGWKAMDLSFNLATSYRDLKDPTSRQNFEDTVEQKRVIDLIPCRMFVGSLFVFYVCLYFMFVYMLPSVKLLVC